MKYSHRQKQGSEYFSFFIEEEQNWGEKHRKLKYKKLRQNENKLIKRSFIICMLKLMFHKYKHF